MKSPEAAARTLEGEMLLAVLKHWKRPPAYLEMGQEQRQKHSIVLEKPFRKDARRARREDRATFETVRAMIESA